MRLRSQQGRCAGASLSASSGRRAATQNGSLARTTAQQLRCVCSSAAQSSSGAHASCCSQLLASSGSAAAALAQKIATPQRSQWGSGAQRPRGVQARAQAQSVGTVVKQPGADKEVRWGSALSRATTLSEAMDEAVGSILGSIGRDSKPDLAIVFASSVHGEEFEQLVPMLRERVPSLRTVFGCSVRAAAAAACVQRQVCTCASSWALCCVARTCAGLRRGGRQPGGAAGGRGRARLQPGPGAAPRRESGHLQQL